MHRKAMWVMMCRNMGRIVSWGSESGGTARRSKVERKQQ
jgi:hypothetical protein